MRARYDELRAESRVQPGHQNPHVDDPWIAQCQGVVIADTDEEAEAIARRAWTAYGRTLQPTHGLIPAHLQTEIPEWDNPLAKQMMSLDPIESQLVVAGTAERVRDYYVEHARPWGRELLHADAPVRRHEPGGGHEDAGGFHRQRYSSG